MFVPCVTLKTSLKRQVTFQFRALGLSPGTQAFTLRNVAVGTGCVTRAVMVGAQYDPGHCAVVVQVVPATDPWGVVVPHCKFGMPL